MKKRIIKISIIFSVVLFSIFILTMVFDKIIMQAYVSSSIYEIPDVSGMYKTNAIELLKHNHLTPIIKGTRFDENVELDHVILQDPIPGRKVKENRNVYLYLSGGEPKINMPDLIGKSLRDAKVTLERLGFSLAQIQRKESEERLDVVIKQEFEPGILLAKGDSVSLTVSLGPQIGMIRVPNLLGENLSEAKKILQIYSLRIGNISYLNSNTLLPNTILDQYPSKDKLVAYGDSIDVVLSKEADDN